MADELASNNLFSINNNHSFKTLSGGICSIIFIFIFLILFIINLYNFERGYNNEINSITYGSFLSENKENITLIISVSKESDYNEYIYQYLNFQIIGLNICDSYTLKIFNISSNEPYFHFCYIFNFNNNNKHKIFRSTCDFINNNYKDHNLSNYSCNSVKEFIKMSKVYIGYKKLNMSNSEYFYEIIRKDTNQSTKFLIDEIIYQESYYSFNIFNKKLNGYNLVSIENLEEEIFTLYINYNNKQIVNQSKEDFIWFLSKNFYFLIFVYSVIYFFNNVLSNFYFLKYILKCQIVKFKNSNYIQSSELNFIVSKNDRPIISKNNNIRNNYYPGILLERELYFTFCNYVKYSLFYWIYQNSKDVEEFLKVYQELINIISLEKLLSNLPNKNKFQKKLIIEKSLLSYLDLFKNNNYFHFNKNKKFKTFSGKVLTLIYYFISITFVTLYLLFTKLYYISIYKKSDDFILNITNEHLINNFDIDIPLMLVSPVHLSKNVIMTNNTKILNEFGSECTDDQYNIFFPNKQKNKTLIYNCFNFNNTEQLNFDTLVISINKCSIKDYCHTNELIYSFLNDFELHIMSYDLIFEEEISLKSKIFSFYLNNDNHNRTLYFSKFYIIEDKNFFISNESIKQYVNIENEKNYLNDFKNDSLFQLFEIRTSKTYYNYSKINYKIYHILSQIFPILIILKYIFVIINSLFINYNLLNYFNKEFENHKLINTSDLVLKIYNKKEGKENNISLLSFIKNSLLIKDNKYQSIISDFKNFISLERKLNIADHLENKGILLNIDIFSTNQTFYINYSNYFKIRIGGILFIIYLIIFIIVFLSFAIQYVTGSKYIINEYDKPFVDYEKNAIFYIDIPYSLEILKNETYKNFPNDINECNYDDYYEIYNTEVRNESRKYFCSNFNRDKKSILGLDSILINRIKIEDCENYNKCNYNLKIINIFKFDYQNPSIKLKDDNKVLDSSYNKINSKINHLIIRDGFIFNNNQETTFFSSTFEKEYIRRNFIYYFTQPYVTIISVRFETFDEMISYVLSIMSPIYYIFYYIYLYISEFYLKRYILKIIWNKIDFISINEKMRNRFGGKIEIISSNSDIEYLITIERYIKNKLFCSFINLNKDDFILLELFEEVDNFTEIRLISTLYN